MQQEIDFITKEMMKIIKTRLKGFKVQNCYDTFIMVFIFIAMQLIYQ
jgi:hypothetical protein